MTQNPMIIEYMMKYGSITPLQAMQDLGCMRLASRISEIEKMGFVIGRETINVKNRFGRTTPVRRYWINSFPEVLA